MKTIFRIFAFCILFTAALCMAQTPAPAPGLSFGVTTSAVGIRLNGVTIPAADATESLAFMRGQNYGMIYLEGHQITSTDQTFNAYLAGVKWTPNMDGLIAKTLLPANTFQVSLHAAPGFVRNAAGRSALGGIAGVSLDYAPNADGHFAVNLLRADYLSASGFGKKPSGYAFSSGIAVYFGGTK